MDYTNTHFYLLFVIILQDSHHETHDSVKSCWEPNSKVNLGKYILSLIKNNN